MQLALSAPAESVRFVRGLASARAAERVQRSHVVSLLVPALLERADSEDGELIGWKHYGAAPETVCFPEHLVIDVRDRVAHGEPVAIEIVWGVHRVTIALVVSTAVVTGTRLYTLWDGQGRIVQLPEHELKLRIVGYAMSV
jgi:hypothetical protein